MAHRGRHSADDVLAAALAVGKSVRAAAADAKVSVRTAGRRLQDSAFQAEIARLRAEMISQAAGRLASTMDMAAAVLVTLTASQNPPAIRLKAASKLIELGLRVKECTDIESRLQALEADARHRQKGEGKQQ